MAVKLRHLFLTLVAPLMMAQAAGAQDQKKEPKPGAGLEWSVQTSYTTMGSAAFRHTEKQIGLDTRLRQVFSGAHARPYVEGGLQVPVSGKSVGAPTTRDFVVTNGVGEKRGNIHFAAGLRVPFLEGDKTPIALHASLFARENFMLAQKPNMPAPRITPYFAVGAGVNLDYQQTYGLEASIQYGLGNQARIDQTFVDGQRTSQAVVQVNVGVTANLAKILKWK